MDTLWLLYHIFAFLAGHCVGESAGKTERALWGTGGDDKSRKEMNLRTVAVGIGHNSPLLFWHAICPWKADTVPVS